MTDRALFEFTSIAPYRPPDKQLADFLANRERLRESQRVSQPELFIEQLGHRGERATCMIASRLNGLVGIGAIRQSEARSAHETLSSGTAFSWELEPDLGLMLPYAGWFTIKQAFNKLDLLPVSVEFSSMLETKHFQPNELGRFIRMAAGLDVATIMSRTDTRHDVALVPNEAAFLLVDSRKPAEPQSIEVNDALDYLYQDTESRIQMLHES